MSQITKKIPEGHHTITPYLVVKDAKKAIKFYQEAFGAQEIERHDAPEGKILHARLKIGNSMIMLSDEFPPPQGCGMVAPASLKGTPVMLHIYSEDVDSAYKRATKAGAKMMMPLEDMFWGERYCQVEDPFGHRWSISTPLENPSKMAQHKASECCTPKPMPKSSGCCGHHHHH